MGEESFEYIFLTSGSEGGLCDERYAGIYELTMDTCNGYARNISVILQPYEDISVILQPYEEKPIAEPVIAKLDEFLDQAENLGFRSFKPWLENLVRLNKNPFMRPFRRE